MNHPIQSVEDLIANESFQEYCLRPDAKLKIQWDIWRKQHPEKEEMFTTAVEIVRQLALQPSGSAVDAAWTSFESARLPTIDKKPTTRRSLHWIAMAACLLAAVSLAIWHWADFFPTTQKVDTPFGKFENLTLTDGTQVWLNANSSLSYAEDWSGQQDREVWLEGEAYFDVQADPTGKRFLVHTEKGTVEVLGTGFNVNQRRSTLDVVLVEGKVQLLIPDHEALSMAPGERIEVNARGLIARSQPDVESLTAWTKEKMVFKAVPIAKIIERLKDEFNLDVEVADAALLERKVTASIPKSNPQLLLEALSQIYELSIEQTGALQYKIE
ncbi:MAG: FecR domain-containing protein [Bacteroidota bacterium]